MYQLDRASGVPRYLVKHHSGCVYERFSPALRMELTPLVLLVFRSLDSGLNYIPGFPGSPVCQIQTLELLSLHKA